MSNYNDLPRTEDAARLNAQVHRGELVTEVERALAVLLTDRVLRPVLDVLDPKAVEQARKALRLTS